MQRFSFTPKIKKILVALLVVFVGFAGFIIYRTVSFHIIKTDPKISAFSANAPYLRVYFNRHISSDSIQVQDDESGIIDRTETSGKTITFYFDGSLATSVDYTIVLKRVIAIDGDELRDIRFVFTAQDIAFNNLSTEQKKAVVAAQDAPIYDVNNIEYQAFDSLLDNGITSNQLQTIKMRLFDYSNVLGEEFRTMRILPSTIVDSGHDPSSAETIQTISFKAVLGSTTYTVAATYDLLYDNVNITLSDTTGTLLYDSLASD